MIKFDVMEIVKTVLSIILGMAAILLIVCEPTDADSWGVIIITKAIGIVFLVLSIWVVGGYKDDE